MIISKSFCIVVLSVENEAPKRKAPLIGLSLVHAKNIKYSEYKTIGDARQEC